jgi:DNA-binding NtrC family response regulator
MPNVLIVEDDPIIVLLLKISYETLGFKVLDTVDCVDNAMQVLLENNDIHLVSLDITLIDAKKGTLLAIWMRQNNINIPILFVSGSIDYRAETEAISNSYFLEKPILASDITKALRQLKGLQLSAVN